MPLLCRSLAVIAGFLLCGSLAGAQSFVPGVRSDPIVDLRATPDGRHLAVVNTAGELGVLNLTQSEPLKIRTEWVSQGFSWSPDGSALAFIERPPAKAPRLGIYRISDEKTEWYFSNLSLWFGEPGWLDGGRIVVRSSYDSPRICVVTVDLATTQTRKLLDPGRDVTGLVVSPSGGEFVYSVSGGEQPELWWWREGVTELVRLTKFLPVGMSLDDVVSYFPGQRRVAYVTQSGTAFELVILDLKSGKQVDSLPLAGAPRMIRCTQGGEILLSMEDGLYSWAPRRILSRKAPRKVTWDGLELRCPEPLGREGVAGVASRNILVISRFSRDLAKATLRFRTSGDLIDLSRGLQAAGGAPRALGLLEDLAGTAKDDDARLNIRLAEAWIERADGRAVKARERIIKALEENPAASPDLKSAAWGERLALTFFELQRGDQTHEIIALLPNEARENPLATWVSEQTETYGDSQGEGWREAGKAFRARKWGETGAHVAGIIDANPHLRLNKEGLALLLAGAFEPLDIPLALRSDFFPELQGDASFQYALLKAATTDLTPEYGRDALRGLLLAELAGSGRLDAARELCRIDLQDPAGSVIDYADILNRYLDNDEQEPWMEKAVANVLLSPGTANLIDRQLVDARGHLLFKLAQARFSFSENRIEALGKVVDQIEEDIALLPDSFWDAGTGRLLYLARVFRAKHLERSGRLDEAIGEYDLCMQVMDRFPGDWNIAGFDIAAARALIAAGRADPDDLHTYLSVIRELGDPLVNPAYQAEAINPALMNLDALEHGAVPAWLVPFSSYSKAACYALLNRPYRAIDELNHTKSLKPPDALTARILLEEAADRSTLGQHTLSVQILTQLCRMPLHPSQLSVAIKTRAQAEKEAGLIFSQEDRIRYLSGELYLPRRWASTMIEGPDFEPPAETPAP